MKMPFAFNLKLVFRLLLPGFVFALALYPLLHSLLNSLGVTLAPETLLTLSSVFCGWLLVVLDMQIYMGFEGRRYWPAPVHNLFIKREQGRLQHLLAALDKPETAAEASVELRRFPTDGKGEFYAAAPTRIGNLITAYEEYPKRCYGMDSIFYWYRLWLLLDNDLREELDNQQALADSTLYTAVALKICGLAALAYALMQMLNPGSYTYLPDSPVLLALAGASWLAAYLLYRLSLHLHAVYGEIFKSLFDSHRGLLDPQVDAALAEVAARENINDLEQRPQAEKYQIAWRYLHNNRFKDAAGQVRTIKPAA
ncbi:hypothetical protein [Candidatus Venteria ishoeyi]|uniref:Uncharacterized protein n=1 Tax=Candidatus Venteria ishoeyi TaxID=1899563 RepID=A0A1H6F6C1_9GAMM|nr:hypothetical protein [Candidatus Venteria ishoeyi]SEH04636.1 Uncharacterised protein [Candidatus Venteria ishoeyi]